MWASKPRVVDLAPEYRLHGPLQGGADHLLALFGGGPDPGGQELLVEAIRGRGRIRGSSGLPATAAAGRCRRPPRP